MRGSITQGEACDRFGISPRELRDWCRRARQATGSPQNPTRLERNGMLVGKAGWRSAMIAGLTVFVAACAALIAYWQGHTSRELLRENREFNRLSVQPYVLFGQNYVSRDEMCCGIHLVNSGTGPAIIRRVVIEWNGHRADNLAGHEAFAASMFAMTDEMLLTFDSQIVSHLGSLDEPPDFLSSSIEGTHSVVVWGVPAHGSALTVEAVARLLNARVEASSIQPVEVFRDELREVRIAVEYCSLYDECQIICWPQGLCDGQGGPDIFATEHER